MKYLIKRTLFYVIYVQIILLQKLFEIFGIKHFIKGDFFETLLVETTDIPIGNSRIRFHTPNKTSKSRAQLFYTKEPETINWIRSFTSHSVFWDVGANIGIYSIYAAKTVENIKVIAVEPSIENTYLLNRNISENCLYDHIFCYPLALSSVGGPNMFKHKSIDFGGSMNAFGVDYGHDGRPASFLHQYQVFGFKADDLNAVFGIPQPNYLKIDVDGIEHLIVRGAKRILSNASLKSVLIELNREFGEQHDEVIDTLKECGLKLLSTHPPNLQQSGGPTANTYNYIFIRP